MPRQPRVCVADMPFHIVQRGNNRSPCFAAAQDYERYLALLTQWTAWHGVAVHAYVLMTNHIHVLGTPKQDDSLSRAMKMVAQLYAQHVNRKYRRTGTLWEHRFDSCLVDSESYLLICHRYIESNPVRAGMVPRPEDYPWSSYRTNALGAANPLISAHSAVQSLGPTPAERQAAYRELFREDLAPSLVEEIRSNSRGGNYALGPQRFRNTLASRLGRPVERQRRGPKKGKSGTKN